MFLILEILLFLATVFSSMIVVFFLAEKIWLGTLVFSIITILVGNCFCAFAKERTMNPGHKQTHIRFLFLMGNPLGLTA